MEPSAPSHTSQETSGVKSDLLLGGVSGSPGSRVGKWRTPTFRNLRKPLCLPPRTGQGRDGHDVPVHRWPWWPAFAECLLPAGTGLRAVRVFLSYPSLRPSASAFPSYERESRPWTNSPEVTQRGRSEVRPHARPVKSHLANEAVPHFLIKIFIITI